MKTCLRARFEDGKLGELLDLSFVEDGHEFGPQPDGTIHIEGHGELTVTRGKTYEDGPLEPPALNGVPFSEVTFREDGHL